MKSPYLWTGRHKQAHTREMSSSNMVDSGYGIACISQQDCGYRGIPGAKIVYSEKCLKIKNISQGKCGYREIPGAKLFVEGMP